MKTTNIILLFTLCISTLFLYKVKQSQPKTNTDHLLIVGTSPDYPPYTFYDKQKNIIGFDIDIAHEVAQRLNKKIIVKDMPFHSLIFELFGKEIDIIAAGMTPTNKKSKKVSFSHPYLDGDALVILTNPNDESINSIDQLHGKKIAVNIGYTADMYLSNINAIELVRLERPDECFMALSTGTVDAFVAAKSSLSTFLKTQNNKQFNQFTIPDTNDSYALVVNKHNIELLQKINNAIDAMKKDGTIQKLKQKWNLI